MTQTPPILEYQSSPLHRADRQGPWATLGMVLIWMCASVGMLAITMCLGGPVWALAAVASLTLALREFRYYRGMIVLGYLEQATQLNLPLSEYLLASAAGETKKIAQRLRAVREMLDSGCEVGVALGEAVPEVPPRVVGVVKAGERLGQLRDTLRRAVFEERQRPVLLIDQAVFLRFYPLFVLSFGSFLVLGIMFVVVPKFREIFADFRTTLPPATERLIGISNFLGEGPFGVLLLVLAVLVILYFVSLHLAEIFTPYQRRSVLGREMWDRLIWICPLAHGLVRDRGLADFFDVLAAGMQVGRPLPATLRETRNLWMNQVLAQCVARVADEVDAGKPLSEAVHAGELPALVKGMVASGEAAGSLPETCGFLARYYRGRHNHARIILQMAGAPLMVLGLALVVGYVVVALFLPLGALINQQCKLSGIL